MGYCNRCNILGVTARGTHTSLWNCLQLSLKLYQVPEMSPHLGHPQSCAAQLEIHLRSFKHGCAFKVTLRAPFSRRQKLLSTWCKDPSELTRWIILVKGTFVWLPFLSFAFHALPFSRISRHCRTHGLQEHPLPNLLAMSTNGTTCAAPLARVSPKAWERTLAELLSDLQNLRNGSWTCSSEGTGSIFFMSACCIESMEWVLPERLPPSRGTHVLQWANTTSWHVIFFEELSRVRVPSSPNFHKSSGEYPINHVPRPSQLVQDSVHNRMTHLTACWSWWWSFQVLWALALE